MKSRINLVWLLFCSLILVLGNGCNKCDGGCDVTVEITGAVLKVPADTVLLPGPSHETIAAHLYLLSTSTSRSGDNNCGGKSMTLCFDDAIDTNRIRIRCNGDLHLVDTTIKTGVDLLSIPALTERKFGTQSQANLAALTLQAGPHFKPGRYTFILDGLTRDGKGFADTAYITWY